MAETEGIINSRPLTVETLSDVNSQFPLPPSNLLTQKNRVILPPPGNLGRPYLHSRRRWKQIQHIAGEFRSLWRIKVLPSLQIRQKWNTKKRDFEVDDIVLLMEDLGRNKWPIARVVKIEPDWNGAVCSVKLRTVDSSDNQKLLRRPINKTVLLVENELVRFPTEDTNIGQDDHLKGAICRNSEEETLSQIKNSRIETLCKRHFANSEFWM